jgi:N-acetylglucosaminyldiphosphoundecaprenol N-acetyl-beta-D-mannosaminyltransferase
MISCIEKKVNLIDKVSVDLISYDDAIEKIYNEGKNNTFNPPFVVTPNVQHYYLYSSLEDFRKLYAQAFLSLLDGMPLVILARFIYKQKVERITGSDIFIDLTKKALSNHAKVFLLGSKPGIAQKAIENLGFKENINKTAFFYSPPLNFEHDFIENNKIYKMVNDIRPNILFVGLGSPKGELWVYHNRHLIESGVILCVGASFNFAAGTTRRAPLWVQRMCMEWFYRLMFEPKRLFKRYLVTNTYFLKDVFLKLILRK